MIARVLFAVLAMSSIASAQPKAHGRSKPACSRVIAANVPFKDLKLVGKVLQGTVRKVLVVDATNRGHIVAAGECVGRERIPFDEVLTPRPPPAPRITPGTLAAR